MVILSAEVTDDIKEYVESLIDKKVILNRSDAIRQIFTEHRDNINERPTTTH